MRKNLKKNKVFGYIIIIVGLIILSLPFLKRLHSEYENKKEIKEVIKVQKKEFQKLDYIEKRAQEYNETIKDSDIAMVDPFTVEDFGSRTILDNPDEIFAYIEIPKLEKYIPIYLDASYDHIAWGLGQISGTSIPIGGESTRSVLAGHRGWWGDTMLLYADDLVNGDSIFIHRGDKTLTYKVYDKEVIGPYDWESLRIIPGEDIISLLTCHPFIWPRPDRLVVNAKRVQNEEKIKEKIEKNEVSTRVIVTNYIYLVFLLIDLGLIIFVISKIRKVIRK